jgi:hypothetical protein
MTAITDSLFTVLTTHTIHITGDHSCGFRRKRNSHDFYTQALLQITAQLVLLLPYISAQNHSHVRGAKNVEDVHSILSRLSNKNCRIFIHINFIHKHRVLLTHMKITTQIKY